MQGASQMLEGELKEHDGVGDGDDDDVEDDSNSCPMLSPFYMPSSFMCLNSLNPDNNLTQ